MSQDIKVLWVDDDSAKLRVVEDLLEGEGIDFIHARSIEEAFQEIGDFIHIPVLLLDAILAPPRDPDLAKLLVDDKVTSEHSSFESGGRLASRPMEEAMQGSYEDLEKGGRLFQDLCRVKGVTFGKTIVISYVREEVLIENGYDYDVCISKLDLADSLGYLRREIESAVEALV